MLEYPGADSHLSLARDKGPAETEGLAMANCIDTPELMRSPAATGGVAVAGWPGCPVFQSCRV